VNLGTADEDQEGLSVTGRNVVPPRPDAAVRNKPPRYPSDAVRRHAEGSVGLRVHVTELGVAAWVEVIASSGDGSLDRAARDAVALWRFQPAQDAGRPVAFDYDFEIRFRMGDS
jgi:protein TonB